MQGIFMFERWESMKPYKTDQTFWCAVVSIIGSIYPMLECKNENQTLANHAITGKRSKSKSLHCFSF